MIPEVSGDPGKILNTPANDMGTSFLDGKLFKLECDPYSFARDMPAYWVFASSGSRRLEWQNEDLDRRGSFY
jgi:hypothetical protein